MRLSIVFPVEMQTAAIIGAACEVRAEAKLRKKKIKSEGSVGAEVEIMIPLIGHVNELKVMPDQ